MRERAVGRERNREKGRDVLLVNSHNFNALDGGGGGGDKHADETRCTGGVGLPHLRMVLDLPRLLCAGAPNH
jgi:hypothetical protein